MKVFILITLMVAGLVGCGGSSNKIDDPVNVLKTLSSQDANSEASMINNANQLKSDINALFNSIDPVEVEAGDSIQNVIRRAEGS